MLTRRSIFQALTCTPALSLVGCASLSREADPGEKVSIQDDPVWSGWEEQRFPGKRPTVYRLDSDSRHGGSIVKASAKGSASMLRRKLDIAANRLGEIEFTWRAERISVEADIGNISATDAPVRIVLAFDGDRSRWSAKDSMLNELSRVLMGEDMPYATLVYTWCAHSTKNSVVNNPRTQTVRNLILESGTENQGRWLSYRRNVREDFRRVFDEEPGTLTSMALMTDADNTQSHTEGWYGGVRIRQS